MWKVLAWWLHFYYWILKIINEQKSVKCYFFMISLLWYNILYWDQFHCDTFTDFCQTWKFRDKPLTEWNFIEKIDFWSFSKCPQGWLIFMNAFLQYNDVPAHDSSYLISKLCTWTRMNGLLWICMYPFLGKPRKPQLPYHVYKNLSYLKTNGNLVVSSHYK